MPDTKDAFLLFALVATLSPGGVLTSQRLRSPRHLSIVNRVLALLLAACVIPLWI